MAVDSFRGKVVWITGASSGIGRALASEFSLAGANLVLSARRKPALEATRNACQSETKTHLLPFDITDFDGLPQHVDHALQVFGHIDYMVHNAGVALRDWAVETDIVGDRRIMDINYFGPVALTKALLPSMLERRSGSFVIVSSLAGKYGVPQLSAYSASKHALHGFFESLRAEVHDHDVRITLAVVGFVRTPILSHAVTGGGGRYSKTLQAQARGLQPQDCARRILKAVARRREEALVAGSESVTVHLKRFFPHLLGALMRRHPVKMRDRLLSLFERSRTEN
jgi:short-subunit dehydrogenase